MKIAPTLRSSMERLRHAGVVNGLALAWRRQPLVTLLPYADYRSERLIHAVLDAREHFGSGGHAVETFWFGFDDLCVMATFREECSLVVLHSRTDDADALAQVSSAFLADAQLLIQAALDPSGSNIEAGDTQALKDWIG
jgi:hypothetical protein